MSTQLPERFTVSPTQAGERWWMPRQSQRLSAAMALLGIACALVALFVVPDVEGGVAAIMQKLVVAVCGGLALFCLAAAYGLYRSGMYIDATGVRGQGLIRSRRLVWDDVVDFQAIVPDRGFDRGHAIVRARMSDGSRVTIPGTRIEGRRQNLSEYLDDASAVADALNTRMLDPSRRPGGRVA